MAAFLCGTTCINHRAGDWDTSTIHKTQISDAGGRLRWHKNVVRVINLLIIQAKYLILP